MNWPMFQIWRIRKFPGLMDLYPSIIKQKKQEKPWFLLFCDFFMTFYLWKMMKMYQKLICKQLFLVGVLKVTDEKTRIRSWIRLLKVWIRGSDAPYQNVTDPERWNWLMILLQQAPSKDRSAEEIWTSFIWWSGYHHRTSIAFLEIKLIDLYPGMSCWRRSWRFAARMIINTSPTLSGTSASWWSLARYFQVLQYQNCRLFKITLFCELVRICQLGKDWCLCKGFRCLTLLITVCFTFIFDAL